MATVVLDSATSVKKGSLSFQRAILMQRYFTPGKKNSMKHGGLTSCNRLTAVL